MALDPSLNHVDIDDSFKAFDQKDDVFRRSWFDPSVKTKGSERFYRTYREPLETWRKADGFTQKDYALRNAAWHISDLFTEANTKQDRREGFSDAFTQNQDVAAARTEFETPQAASDDVKRVAKLVGADDAGITKVDPRWLYSKKFSDMSGTSRDNDIPADMPNVIVTVQAMDHGLLKTVPSALSGAATGLGYSHDALVVLALTQYIRNLGYRAIGSMNDSSLCIPMAIQAGLGEYGRNGLLITPNFGPRIRLGKVFTDMPLAHDAPTRFGVQRFCESCQRCASACPVKAIPSGEATVKRHNVSNIGGVRKWSVDGEKCFSYWTKQNTDCAICIRVCPYNRDYSKLGSRLWRRAAKLISKRAPDLIGALIRLDDKMGHGLRVKPTNWWHRAK